MSPNINLAFSTKKIKAKYYIWLSINSKRIAYQLPYVSYTERCVSFQITRIIMTETISRNLNRVSFHDSHIEKIIRENDDKIIFEIDWAKLENYTENKISEAIIIGKCELILEKIINEKLIIDNTNIKQENKLDSGEIEFNYELFKNGFLILTSECDNKKFKIGGIIDYYNEANGWLDWEFRYNKFELKWNDSVSQKEWLDGKELSE